MIRRVLWRCLLVVVVVCRRVFPMLVILMLGILLRLSGRMGVRVSLILCRRLLMSLRMWLRMILIGCRLL